jgi:hypothetical protein
MDWNIAIMEYNHAMMDLDFAIMEYFLIVCLFDL